MIKDVMVWVDGSNSDDVRLEAAGALARQFDGQVVALYLNSLPMVGPIDGPIGVVVEAELLDKAREAGDLAEARLIKRLQQLRRPTEIRRFDVLANDIANIAAREARTADTFVALRPNGAMDPERLIEGVLFEAGRHLYLFPETERPKIQFDRILVAWNGSREAARAVAEGMPFLQRAKEVTVVVVTDKRATEEDRLGGVRLVNYLKHHSVQASLRYVTTRRNPSATLIAEVRQEKADLIVMGAYGHIRLREWLLGGVTYNLLHEAPIPILMAH